MTAQRISACMAIVLSVIGTPLKVVRVLRQPEPLTSGAYEIRRHRTKEYRQLFQRAILAGVTLATIASANPTSDTSFSEFMNRFVDRLRVGDAPIAAASAAAGISPSQIKAHSVVTLTYATIERELSDTREILRVQPSGASYTRAECLVRKAFDRTLLDAGFVSAWFPRARPNVRAVEKYDDFRRNLTLVIDFDVSSQCLLLARLYPLHS
ncbi:MAG TPA: hypothetical protein VG248_03965 [Caulobacteraceae bacterium]|jgi:hypothetical protein|nr:hypothetical protein [Caulobacteraceae bacterium]